MQRLWIVALAACVGLLSVTPLAQADLLLPGQTVSLAAPEGTLGGANFDMIPFTPFSFTPAGGGVVSGMYREFVSSGRPGNPLGGLSFEYQFNLDAMSDPAIQAFGASGFAGWTTNVTFTPGGAIPPSSASRSSNGDGIEFTITAGGGVQPGQTSMWLIVDTDAPGETLNTISLAGNGGATTALTALGPAVPEPGTLTLALVGLLVGGAFSYRRLRQPVRA